MMPNLQQMCATWPCCLAPSCTILPALLPEMTTSSRTICQHILLFVRASTAVIEHLFLDIVRVFPVIAHLLHTRLIVLHLLLIRINLPHPDNKPQPSQSQSQSQPL